VESSRALGEIVNLRGEPAVGTHMNVPRIWVGPEESFLDLLEGEAQSRSSAQSQSMKCRSPYRCSGLIARLPDGVEHVWAKGGMTSEEKVRFHGAVLRSFNLVLAQLALDGEISQPVAPVDIAPAGVLDRYAAIAQGTESRTPRTVEPSLSLLSGRPTAFSQGIGRR
jgi:hypothetical protein